MPHARRTIGATEREQHLKDVILQLEFHARARGRAGGRGLQRRLGGRGGRKQSFPASQTSSASSGFQNWHFKELYRKTSGVEWYFQQNKWMNPFSFCSWKKQAENPRLNWKPRMKKSQILRRIFSYKIWNKGFLFSDPEYHPPDFLITDCVLACRY